MIDECAPAAQSLSSPAMGRYTLVIPIPEVCGVLVASLRGLTRRPEGEQEFELAAGESVTVTGITRPVGMGAVGG